MQEEIERRERIEKRKQELAINSCAPSSLIRPASTSAISRKRIEQAAAHRAATTETRFVAEDPDRVAFKLELRQKKWEETLELAKFRARELQKQRTSALLGSKTAKGAMSAMEQRSATAAARRRLREDAKAAKTAQEDRARVMQQKRKLENLQNAALPMAGRRLTHASEVRASTVS